MTATTGTEFVAADAASSATIIDTIRSEWIKLRTTRTTVVLLLCALGLELLVVGLTSVFASADDFDTEVLVGAITFTTIPVGLMIGVIGSLAITSEFVHGTIRPTFAATPRRGRVFTAKFLVITAAVAVGGAAVVTSATVMGWLVLQGRGAEVDFSSSPGGLAPVVGSVALMVILTWLGYGLGLLTRSSPLAIVVLVLWPLLIENIVGGLLFVAGVESALRWLPYNAGFVLATTEIPEDSMGRWQGGLYFGVITLGLVVLGALANRGRDA